MPPTVYNVDAIQQAPAGTHVISPPSAPISFTVDTHVPQTPELDPPATPSSDHLPTFTGSAEALDSYEIDDALLGTVCQGTVASTSSFSCIPAVPLGDGDYLLTARSVSRAGVSSAPSNPARPLTIFTPTQIPAPTLDAPQSPTNNARPTFTGAATGGVTVSLRIPGQTLCSGPVALGTLELPARDAAGRRNLRADRARRRCERKHLARQQLGDAGRRHRRARGADHPGAGERRPCSTIRRVTARGTAQVASTVALTLDGASAGTASPRPTTEAGQLPLGTLAFGMHTLSATAADAAGNVSPAAQVSFEIEGAGTVRGGCASGGIPVAALRARRDLFLLAAPPQDRARPRPEPSRA